MKLVCLYLGPCEAPIPSNDASSPVLDGPREAGIGRNVSVVCIVPNFNVQHRWRDNSYGFQVGGVLFVAFVSEAFFGLKKASK